MKGVKLFTLDNNRNLTLKEVLVEYEMIPLFFICQDNDKNLYSVIRKYIDEEEYIVVENESTDIIKMLNNEIEMRSLFLKQEYFWEIIYETSSEETAIFKKHISEIDVEDLPAENDFFGDATEESIRLVEELNFNLSTKDSSSMDFIFDMIQNQYDERKGERLRMYVEMICREQLKNRSLFTATGYVQKKPIMRQTTDYTVSDTEDTVCVNANANINIAA